MISLHSCNKHSIFETLFQDLPTKMDNLYDLNDFDLCGHRIVHQDYYNLYVEFDHLYDESIKCVVSLMLNQAVAIAKYSIIYYKLTDDWRRNNYKNFPANIMLNSNLEIVCIKYIKNELLSRFDGPASYYDINKIENQSNIKMIPYRSTYSINGNYFKNKTIYKFNSITCKRRTFNT